MSANSFPGLDFSILDASIIFPPGTPLTSNFTGLAGIMGLSLSNPSHSTSVCLAMLEYRNLLGLVLVLPLSSTTDKFHKAHASSRPRSCLFKIQSSLVWPSPVRPLPSRGSRRQAAWLPDGAPALAFGQEVGSLLSLKMAGLCRKVARALLIAASASSSVFSSASSAVPCPLTEAGYQQFSLSSTSQCIPTTPK